MSTSASASTVTCRSCGAEIDESALLCPKCGQPNISTEFATTEYYVATEPIPEEQAMAPPTLAPEPPVGESAPAATVVIAPTPPFPQQPGYPQSGYLPEYQAEPAARRGFPVWGWVLIAVVVVFVAAAVALGLMVSQGFVSESEPAAPSNATPVMVTDVSPSGTINNFYDALALGNYSTARGYLDSSLASENSEELLITRWTEFVDGGTAVYWYYDIETRADAATIGITFVAPSSEKSVELSLTKIGNDWMITEANPDLIPSP